MWFLIWRVPPTSCRNTPKQISESPRRGLWDPFRRNPPWFSSHHQVFAWSWAREALGTKSGPNLELLLQSSGYGVWPRILQIFRFHIVIPFSLILSPHKTFVLTIAAEDAFPRWQTSCRAPLPDEGYTRWIFVHGMRLRHSCTKPGTHPLRVLISRRFNVQFWGLSWGSLPDSKLFMS